MASFRSRLTLMACAVALGSAVASSAIAAQRGDPQRGDPQREDSQRGDLQRGDPQRGDSQRGDQRGTGEVGITIFAEPNFRGLSSTFRVDVPNLLEHSMNDRVDSLQIARGEIWEVCQDKNYNGRCRVFTADEADLGRVGWAGMISSLRRLRDNDRRGGARGDFGPPPPMRSRLVLFDDTGFRGRSFAVSDPAPALHALGNRARSAKVYGGAWEVCDGDQFRGRCVTVNGSVPDLGRIGLRDKVSSARPVRRVR